MISIKEFYKTLQQLAFGWNWKKVGTRKKMVVAFFRMLWITFQGFRENLVTLRAASLTYITLVSIIPTLVFSFAVSKGIGATGKLIGIIQTNIADFPEGARIAIGNIISTVQAVDYTKLGTTGFLLAAFTVIKLLGKIENSLNDIWGVKQDRTLMRKFSDYISTVVMIPILILASSSLTIMLSSKMVISQIEKFFGPAAFIVVNIMSFSGVFTIIIAFFLLYVWLPNTRVKILPALVGGIIGGLSWKLMLILFYKFQTSLNDASAVYGTFAALPLFLVWLYSSWVIVLFGAEVSFSVQHWNTYDLNIKEKTSNFSTTMSMSLIVINSIIDSFRVGNHWCPEEFADNNMLSVKSVLATTDILVEKGILESNNDPELHFVPARMLDTITVGDIVSAVSGEKSEQLKSIDSTKNEILQFNDQQWQNYMKVIVGKNILNRCIK
ncbi:YihY/virulence factor BrkB family protein [bacterium]|nr:YihY/virulence factor BrkB family protein [bacterium]